MSLPATSMGCRLMSCCGATTACPPTTWRWSSTTLPPGSTSSCAVTTCCRRRRVSWPSATPSDCRRRATPTSHSWSAPTEQRLAKRDGAITLAALAAAGVGRGCRAFGAGRVDRPRRGRRIGVSRRARRTLRRRCPRPRRGRSCSLRGRAGGCRTGCWGASVVSRFGLSALVASVRCGPPLAPPTGRDSTPIATASSS